MDPSQNLQIEKIARSYDLDQFQDRFYQLYIRENRTLEAVMRMLQDEGCAASRSMYLRQIRVWGYKKNTKRDGSKPPSAREMINTICGMRNGSQFKMPKDSGHQSFAITASPTLRQPDILDGPERFFQAAYTAQAGFVRLQLTKGLPGTEKELSTLPLEFHPNIMNGLIMMGAGQFKTGGAFIERGLRSAEHILRKDPSLLYTLCYHTFVMVTEKFHGLGEIYTKYIYQLSRKLLGENDQLTLFTKSLHQNVDSLATGKGIAVIYDITSRLAGEDSAMSLSAYKILIAYLRDCTDDFLQLCQHYEKLIKQHDNLNHPYKLRGKVSAIMDYLIYLRTQKQMGPVLPLCREVYSLLFQDPPLHPFVLSAVIQFCHEWANVIMSQPSIEGFEEDDDSHHKRYLEAELIMKTTIEKSILLLGPDQVETLAACQQLAKFYTDYGSPELGQIQSDFVQERLAEFMLSDDKN